MKCVVSGGAGFIGSHLVEELLNNNNEVIVLDNLSTGRIENLSHIKKKYNFIKCDLSKKDKWQNLFKNQDYVFHLAGLADVVPSITNPELYFESNVVGTYNILEASKNHGIKKFIYSASSSCYGVPSKYPTSENEICKPQYPYALTKYMGEQMVMHWSEIYKLSSISLRFFNVYGPRSRTSGTYGAVFGVFLKQKIEQKPFTVVGNGEQTRDFTYINDVVRALIKAANSNLKSEIINIGSDDTYSINYLIKLLGGEKIFIPKRPGEPDCTWADITKAKNLLNWSPIISFEEGVNIMLKNISYWKKAPLWDEKSIDIATKNWFKYLDNK